MLYSAQRTLAGTDAVLSWQALDGDGDRRDPTTVTVTVTNSAGSSLTAGSVSGTGSAPRTATVTGAQIPSPDRLTAVWKVSGVTVATTIVDVVGGYIASLAQIKERYPGLADESKWPSAAVIAARNATEDEFTSACGVAFTPRFSVDVLEGHGGDCLILDHQELRSVSWATYRTEGGTTTTAFTAGDIASIDRNGAGIAELTNGSYWPSESVITIGYVHGYEHPPSDVVDAFLVRVNDVLTRQRSSINARATQTVMEGMTTNLAVPGWGANLTGLPDVDVVLKRYDRRIPGIA